MAASSGCPKSAADFKQTSRFCPKVFNLARGSEQQEPATRRYFVPIVRLSRCNCECLRAIEARCLGSRARTRIGFRIGQLASKASKIRYLLMGSLVARRESKVESRLASSNSRARQAKATFGADQFRILAKSCSAKHSKFESLGFGRLRAARSLALWLLASLASLASLSQSVQRKPSKVREARTLASAPRQGRT